MTTEEGNKIILQFMGKEPEMLFPDFYSVSFPPYLYVSGDTPEDVYRQLLPSVPYRQKYEWLIPVIQKLASGHPEFCITIHSHYTLIRYEDKVFVGCKKVGHPDPVEHTWKAIVKTIKHINKS